MLATKIMLVLGERSWTNQALHLTCAIARRQATTITLVKMMPVIHPQMLGTTAGYLQFTPQDEQDMVEYAATAEDYSVEFNIQFCQYANYFHTIMDAAQQLGASDVVACVPASRIAGWQHLQEWWLRWQLRRQQRQLHTLAQNENTLEWTPAMVLNHPG